MPRLPKGSVSPINGAGVIQGRIEYLEAYLLASEAFHQLCYHFVWTTKLRTPVFLEGSRREWMYARICEEVERKGGEATVLHACNVMPEHIHLLVSLPPTQSLSQFIGQVKGATGFAFNREFAPSGSKILDWQDGYGVLSIRQAEADRVIRYIENQEEIHARRRAHPLWENAGGEVSASGLSRQGINAPPTERES